ncbi:Hypothetical protein PACV_29 [Pacmanvirus A23]|uniref:Hypothetical protein n=1 Tax=Pacmanvirus A23 TaxID=1932881 RepID=UPI000A0960C1|nr:Hypothetical protein B9W72_gp029 [Pacmanvirus A23]SIP85746.1 Hypothetical protein PACV_29 [Pacmanvirus A23]
MSINLKCDQNWCDFCNNLRWWCIGCGYWKKVKAFIYLGYSQEEAEEELNIIQGECGEFEACVVCNEGGIIPYVE